ncbi:radical SAM protein [Candidatus Bathyarchaeota archaeon]|nr:radical SAM protein [Candidatus Bathyarchaeota archaeon]
MENLIETKNNLILPSKIRVSIGSAILIGLKKGFINALPETIYLMTFHEGKCLANCGFCAQARESKTDLNHLSRVAWPIFETEKVLNKIEESLKKAKRICIQALNYPNSFNDVASLAKALRKFNIPISISCQPFNETQFHMLKVIGVDKISIPLDASTKEIFEEVKGLKRKSPYIWEAHFEALKKAVKIFGEGNVTTHLILGLGETERDVCFLTQKLTDIGVNIALFALTPIKGTFLENFKSPSINYYRKAQLARHLIVNRYIKFSKIKFNEKGEIIDLGLPKKELLKITLSGKPFLTSGCPNCNRPYYNEKVSGPIYNFPKALTEKEINEVLYSLTSIL